MNKIILMLLVVTVISVSCNKTDTSNPITTTTETSKMILLTTREFDANDQLNTSLTCFNPDKTIRWSRKLLGSAGTPNAAYYNGVIYFSVGFLDLLQGIHTLDIITFIPLMPALEKTFGI